jgi:hypothetical protein
MRVTHTPPAVLRWIADLEYFNGIPRRHLI